MKRNPFFTLEIGLTFWISGILVSAYTPFSNIGWIISWAAMPFFVLFIISPVRKKKATNVEVEE